MNLKLQSLLYYSLLFVIFVLPIPLGANRPWAWNFFQIAIFALTFVTALSHKDKPWLGLQPYLRMIYLWLALIVVAALQLVPLPAVFVEFISPSAFAIQQVTSVESFYLSLDTGQSGISFYKLLSFFCLFCLILMLVNTEQRLKLLLMTMLAAGTFQALYGALEVLLQSQRSLIFQLEVTSIATGSFVYKNHFANFLMLTLAAGLGLLITSLQKDQMSSPKDLLRSIATTMLGSKALIRICLAIMVIALVMSRSRMGNTAFFLAMTLTGILALLIIKQRSKGLSILIISIFIIDLFIVSAYFGLENVKNRLAETSLSEETRDEVITDAMPMLSDFAITGSGAGSFYSVFPKYQKTDVMSFYDHAHNDYLQFAIEYGLPTFTLLAGIVVFAFYKSIRAMRKRRNSIFKGVSFACCMAIIGMCLHMAVDFPLQAYANACYFVIFISLCMLSNNLKIRARGRSLSHS